MRIIGANTTGDPQYWYVLASSPIRTVKELVGRTIAYASNGSSSQYNAFDLMKQFRFKARLVPTGNPIATLEQVVAQHVDVGLAWLPTGIDEIEFKPLRGVVRANDVQGIRDKTVRVLITSADTLEKRKSAIGRFVDAYRETVEWMYADPAALRRFAELAGVSENLAQRLRDQFFTKVMSSPDQIGGAP